MQPVLRFTYAAGLAAAFTVASAGVQAQSPQKQQPGSTKAAQGQSQMSSDDTTFVHQAAQSGKMEVEQGKKAASKASNPQVKSFGSMLVKDHTAANQELMTLARKKNVTIAGANWPEGKRGSVGKPGDATGETKTGGARPDPPGGNPTGTTGASNRVQSTGEARAQMGHDDTWMSQSGAAFDRGFIAAQVTAHQNAIALFEKEASGGSDPDLKAFAAKQLPTLRAHLKQAQDLQSKLGSSTQ
jgi:putative membrane protein